MAEERPEASEVESDEAAPVALRREVLPPLQATAGLAVIIVAATSMLFAVLSSAVILKARMGAACPYERQKAVPVPVDATLAGPADFVPCDTVMTYAGDDGRTTLVVFERCR